MNEFPDTIFNRNKFLKTLPPSSKHSMKKFTIDKIIDDFQGYEISLEKCGAVNDCRKCKRDYICTFATLIGELLVLMKRYEKK